MYHDPWENIKLPQWTEDKRFWIDGINIIVDTITSVCNQTWKTGKRPISWTQLTAITRHKRNENTIYNSNLTIVL